MSSCLLTMASSSSMLLPRKMRITTNSGLMLDHITPAAEELCLYRHQRVYSQASPLRSKCYSFVLIQDTLHTIPP
ncbi:hypothetical protein BX589_1391 [Paraburkholderia fungorum]|nr:hypothetical protein BX589_1391 [Paraburkholderia fungorum]